MIVLQVQNPSHPVDLSLVVVCSLSSQPAAVGVYFTKRQCEDFKMKAPRIVAIEVVGIGL